MGGNGGLWEIAKNTLWEVYKKGVQLVINGREIGERWDSLGQNSHFCQSHFPRFFTASAPFPQRPLMNFASQTSRLEKWKFWDWPISADICASADGWLHVAAVVLWTFVLVRRDAAFRSHLCVLEYKR